MSTSTLATYRKNWPRIGAVLGMILEAILRREPRTLSDHFRELHTLEAKGE